MSTKSKYILSCQNLRKGFTIGSERRTVLNDCNLNVEPGEFVAIMGASGSGKSTLLHILGLLDQPEQGTVMIEGKNVFTISKSQQDKIRNQQIGFVFQFYHLLPELTVEENVILPSMISHSFFSWLSNKSKVKKRASELIESVGLTKQTTQWPNTLSGGERQRTALARALIQNPQILFADEPTGNLDSVAGKAILEILCNLNRSGQTIVMVTHDKAVADLADRTLVLHEGKLS